MKSWLSSPLAINYLLSLCKNGSSFQKKYLQIYKDLKTKKGFTTSNKLFLSLTHIAENLYETSDICIENVEFGERKNTSQCIKKWINQYGSFSHVDVESHVLPNTTSLLCNISIFKGSWKCNRPSPIMTVHNSFSYTEDIKYEARLIELPMQDDDLRLVIVVPNEVSSISGLFSKLVEEGLSAAVGCVRPLFTFTTALEAPSIEFTSEHNVCFTENKCDVHSGVQVGNVQINECDINICLLSLLSSTHKNAMVSADDEQSGTESPFHFAVMYRDTAIFTGRYINRLK